MNAFFHKFAFLLDFENKSADSAIILFKEILKRGFEWRKNTFFATARICGDYCLAKRERL